MINSIKKFNGFKNRFRAFFLYNLYKTIKFKKKDGGFLFFGPVREFVVQHIARFSLLGKIKENEITRLISEYDVNPREISWIILIYRKWKGSKVNDKIFLHLMELSHYINNPTTDKATDGIVYELNKILKKYE